MLFMYARNLSLFLDTVKNKWKLFGIAIFEEPGQLSIKDLHTRFTTSLDSLSILVLLYLQDTTNKNLKTILGVYIPNLQRMCFSVSKYNHILFDFDLCIFVVLLVFYRCLT